jgi:hypothetical protein
MMLLLSLKRNLRKKGKTQNVNNGRLGIREEPSGAGRGVLASHRDAKTFFCDCYPVVSASRPQPPTKGFDAFGVQ